MEIDIVVANSSAGKILLANLLRAMNDSSDGSKLTQAVKPFFAINFIREMFKGMDKDAYRFSVILTRLKRSSLPATWYRALVTHVKSFLTDNSSAIPFVFDGRGRILVRTNSIPTGNSMIGPPSCTRWLPSGFIHQAN